MRNTPKGIAPGRGRGGAGYLALCGAVSALVYAAILARLPLLRIYATPLLNLNHFQASDLPTALAVMACIILLFAAYAVGALLLPDVSHSRAARLLVVSLSLLCAGILFFAHPMTSTDVYDYLFRGRMLARYEANPFVVVPWQFRADPLIKYVAWKLAVTAYGPLWEKLSWVIARLAGEAPGAPFTNDAQLLTLVLAYKGLAVLGFLLCGGAIWLALGGAAPESRWLGLYLWLWNPLVLWETVGTAHNDVWMALPIVLAVAALAGRQGDKETRRQDHEPAQRRSTLAALYPGLAALLALTAGGLIKYVAFFFGPLVLAAALRRLPTRRARWLLLVAGGLACAALVALAYAPFWAGWDTLQNIGARRQLYTASWPGVLHVLLKQAMPEDSAASVAAAASLALLFAGVLWAAWRGWREPGELRGHMLWLSLWFLLVCNPWFQPWYVVWPLALAATQPWRTRATTAAIVLCATAMISYVVGGFVMPVLGLPDKSLGRESWMAAQITIPPLAVLGWERMVRLWRAAWRVPAPIGPRAEQPANSGQGS